MKLNTPHAPKLSPRTKIIVTLMGGAVILLVLFVTKSALLQHLNSYRLVDRPKIFPLPPRNITYMSFGYNEVMADLLWIRAIQDFGQCEITYIPQLEQPHRPVNKPKPAKGKASPATSTLNAVGASKSINANTVDHPAPLNPTGSTALVAPAVPSDPNKNPAPTSSTTAPAPIASPNITSADEEYLGPPLCNHSWVYFMLDAVTKLAPKFRMPYALGGTTLSVMVNDRVGAKVIFDRGVENYPKDWPIIYRAAYHYLFEMKDKKAAAILLYKAAEMGAPIWLKSLAGRLYDQMGEDWFALQTLNAYIKEISMKNIKGRESVLLRIKAIEQRIKNKKLEKLKELNKLKQLKKLKELEK